MIWRTLTSLHSRKKITSFDIHTLLTACIQTSNISSRCSRQKDLGTLTTTLIEQKSLVKVNIRKLICTRNNHSKANCLFSTYTVWILPIYDHSTLINIRSGQSQYSITWRVTEMMQVQIGLEVTRAEPAGVWRQEAFRSNMSALRIEMQPVETLMTLMHSCRKMSPVGSLNVWLLPPIVSTCLHFYLDVR